MGQQESVADERQQFLLSQLSTKAIPHSKKCLRFPLSAGEAPGHRIEHVRYRIREQTGNRRELLVLNQFELF